MKKVYFLLGSNMGDSTAQLALARKKITQKIGKITRMSSLYKTAAWGNTQQPDFINQVIIVETNLSPENTLKSALAIESSMGRTRVVKNEPRVIDIDILFFNKAIIETQNLIVPHPFIQERNFVLTPLNELSPKLIHPKLKETVNALKQKCADKLTVTKIV
jgi:2-amino-4-hydroxy-6-hydroxymethyldihydropteridine diphosphokinase